MNKRQEAADELDYRLGHVHKEFRQMNNTKTESAPSEAVRELRHQAAIARHFGQIAEWASKSFNADQLQAQIDKQEAAQ